MHRVNRGDAQTNSDRDAVLREIAAKLKRHASAGLDELHLLRHQGNQGNTPTGCVWVMEEDDQVVGGADGEGMLIGGQTPEALAESVLEASDDITAAEGKIKACTLVGYRLEQGHENTETHKVFEVKISPKCFSRDGLGQVGGTRDEMMLAMTRLVADVAKNQAATSLRAQSVIPDALEKVVDIIQSQPEPSRGEGKGELLKVLLEHEKDGRREWYAHQSNQSREGNRFKLADEALNLAGPGLELLLFKVVGRLFDDQSAEERTTPEGERCFSSDSLHRSWIRITPENQKKIEALFLQPEWDYLTKLRSCETESEFRAVVKALKLYWSKNSRDENDMRETMQELGRIDGRFLTTILTHFQRAERHRD